MNNTRRGFLGFLAGMLGVAAVPASPAVVVPVAPLSELDKMLAEMRVRYTNTAAENLVKAKAQIDSYAADSMREKIMNTNLCKELVENDPIYATASWPIAPQEGDVWDPMNHEYFYQRIAGGWEKKYFKH